MVAATKASTSVTRKTARPRTQARAHRGTGEMLMKEAFDLCRASSDGLTATCLHLTAFEVASIQKERLIDGALALARLGAW